jgi:hypothetical protein
MVFRKIPGIANHFFFANPSQALNMVIFSQIENAELRLVYAKHKLACGGHACSGKVTVHVDPFLLFEIFLRPL